MTKVDAFRALHAEGCFVLPNPWDVGTAHPTATHAAPAPGFTVAALADLGVRRVSVGSALARTAWGSFMRAARSIAATRTCDELADAASFAGLNALFAPR